MSIYRLAMCGLAVLVLGSCSLSLKGVVRNESGRDVVLLINNHRYDLKAGAVSGVFAPRWTAQPHTEHNWMLAIRAGDCLYRYQTPGYEGGGGAFPQEPAVFVLDKAMVLDAELPGSWGAIGRYITGIPSTPESTCGANGVG